MQCPNCQNSESRVLDSRTAGQAIRRRRICSACDHRFTTHERVANKITWVTKRSGAKETYDRAKVLQGLALATRKRGIHTSELEELVTDVEASLASRAEVSTSDVGEAVMDALHARDPVAYVRFASVYRNFESVEQFAEFLLNLQGES